MNFDEALEQRKQLTDWCEREGVDLRVCRIATPDEAVEYRRWQEG